MDAKTTKWVVLVLLVVLVVYMLRKSHLLDKAMQTTSVAGDAM